MSYVVFKRAYHRRIQGTRVARNPVQAPKPGFRIKEPQLESFETLTLLAWHLSGGINIRIRGAAEDFPILIKRIELGPILAVFEPLVQAGIWHFPFAD